MTAKTVRLTWHEKTMNYGRDNDDVSIFQFFLCDPTQREGTKGREGGGKRRERERKWRKIKSKKMMVFFLFLTSKTNKQKGSLFFFFSLSFW